MIINMSKTVVPYLDWIGLDLWAGEVQSTFGANKHTTTIKMITQVQKLVEDGDWKELGSIMAPRLEFGTAGIRGRMGPGFGRMNDLVIIQVGLQHLV